MLSEEPQFRDFVDDGYGLKKPGYMPVAHWAEIQRARKPALREFKKAQKQVERAKRKPDKIELCLLSLEEALGHEFHISRRPRADEFVYFIAFGDSIKIGYTGSIEARVKQMKTNLPGNPELLHVEFGTKQIERILHHHFRAARYFGEWFHQTTEMLDFMEKRLPEVGLLT